jgi:hypothetical protein
METSRNKEQEWIDEKWKWRKEIKQQKEKKENTKM